MAILSEKSKKIVRLLKKGVSANQLVKKGFPKNTVLYHKRKLFFPERHSRFMSQVRRYQAQALTRPKPKAKVKAKSKIKK